MADPRKTVAYKGLHLNRTTYAIDDSTITYDATLAGGSAGVGLAVTLSADNTIALAGDGDAVLGKLEKVEADGYAVVTEKGHVTLPGGAAATLTRGSKIVGDLDGSANPGYIRAVNTAVAAELGVARGIIRENGTATAVGVIL